MSQVVFRVLASAVLLTTVVQAEEINWQQVRTEIQYVRTGTLATAKEGSFTFEFTATHDQLIEQGSTGEKGALPSYNLPSGYARSFSTSGRMALTAEASQYDEPTHKTYTASASLASSLGHESDLQLTQIASAEPMGVGLTAKFEVGVKLKGNVQSTYPRMPGVTESDAVLMWPTPVAFSTDDGFLSQGEYVLRPKLGRRPEDPAMGQVYDLLSAAYGLEALPGLGGFRPPGVGCVTERIGDSWKIRFKQTQQFDTLVGGQYTDTITVTVYPVAKTLAVPAKLPEAE